MRSLCRSLLASVGMQANPHVQTRRFGLRLVSQARALLFVSALAAAALAVPTRSFAQAPTFNAFVATPKGGEPWFQPNSAAVGDFNHDGKLDALVADGGPNLRLMLGNGDGTFTEHDVSTPLADFGVGVFNRFRPTNPGRTVAADVNGDGLLDAVTVSNGGNWAVTVLINTGNDVNGVPQFTGTNYNTFLTQIRSIATGNLNGDGKPDLVVGTGGGTVMVMMNNGDGTFHASTFFGPNNLNPFLPFHTGRNYYGILPSAGGPSTGGSAIADVNGDGKADYIVASNQSLSTNIFFGNGDGTFRALSWADQPGALNADGTPKAQVVITGAGVGLAVVDVNHDGKPDLLEADGTQLQVFLNSGDGKFSAPADPVCLRRHLHIRAVHRRHQR